MLYVDSLREFETEGKFNCYDKYHIDNIKSTIDVDKLVESVNNRLKELKAQRQDVIVNDKVDVDRLQALNPLIKVK